MGIPVDTITHIYVRTYPKIADVSEMRTILLFSLRSLWGDLESYSFNIAITKPSIDCKNEISFLEGKNIGLLIVECPKESVKAVRAALTLVTPPPYLEENIYQFDVVHLKEVSKQPL